MYFVYVLKCSDGSPYTGCTSNLKARLTRHRKGQVLATSKRLPISLDFCVIFKDKYKAFKFEKYLKSGSGREFTKRHF